ncbi:putative methyltransferase type 11 [Phaeomoniella chlamydospora]|uniref:Putative methyltransferase type 11 n=1 Tax=Phaeomoniella chlamydospora TaxID=158046 RepID=A0A0G2G8K6_PHACM|nr:putative methyltransferase type 11 [Phaeomoniella chlamydospora]
MSHFIPLFESGTITRIYAAEPNEFLHAKLRASARQAGLSDSQYIILHAGGEPSSLLPALSSTGLLTSSSSSIPSSGIFDTILSIRVLCSFTQSDLESTLLVSQALLKPSGKLVFYEHIGNVKDKITQIYVWFLMFIWPIACGGCRLDCKLDLVLNEMTGWKEKKLVEAQGVMDWAVFRFIQGWAQKE